MWLFEAAKEGKTETVIKMIENNIVKVNAKDE